MAEPVHMVVFPFPLQGHIAPALHLVHSLLSNPNVMISFVTSNSHAKSLLVSREKWYWQGIHPDSELRIMGLPDTDEQRSEGEWINEKGEWLGSLDAVFSAFFANLKMEASFKALLQKLQEDSEVSCIIADLTSFWVQSVASSLGIPFAALCTSSATFLLGNLKIKELHEAGYIPLTGGDSHKRIIDLGIPGLDGTQAKDLSFSLQKEDPRDPGFGVSQTLMSEVRGAKLFLLGTCEVLEGEVVEYLKHHLSPNIISVGPLVSIYHGSGGSEAGLWKQDRSCLEWLSEKPDGSVVYISFGSGSDFTFDEIRVLADGIEASGCFFLWVVRRNLVRGVPEDFFPEFVARTEGRGLVISWSPQAEVLRHKAVGGFITHCGWNSCMESLLAGVPMLALPRFVDQSVNARLVCDEWKVGKRLNPGEGALTSSAVVQGIKSLMDSEVDGADMMARARSFQSSIIQASRCNLLSSILNVLSA